MKARNLIRVGIASRKRWWGIDHRTQVLIVSPDSPHVIRLPIVPNPLEFVTTKGISLIPEWDAEDVTFDEVEVGGERAGVGYGPITNTLVVKEYNDGSTR